MYYQQKNFRPIALSLAGFDPSGGAGVLADVKTFEAMKVYGLALNTGITIQNDVHFEKVSWQSESQIKSGLHVLSKRYTVRAAKLGMHKNLNAVLKNIKLLKSYWPGIKIIWDPILASSSGFDLKIELNKIQLKKILSSIDLITPNTEEFNKIGWETSAYNCALLKKGGHAKGKFAEDILFINGREKKKFRSIRKSGMEKHGSGCVLSAAIVSGLARGDSLIQCVSNAKKYINHFLISNSTLSGYHNK